MRAWRATLAALLLTGAAAARAAAQRSPAAPAVDPRLAASWQTFTGVFDAYLARDRIVGGAAVLVRDGRVARHHEYGLADRDPRQPVDTNTLFHYGSITKTLTAVAIMQLRDRGRLSLDDTVTHYLPELRQVHDAFGSMDAITIRMLLSHSSGFQNPTWPWTRGAPWEPFEPTTWNQLVAMMPYEEIAFPPGTRYSYSNPAFIYLARILEQVTGDPYQSYVYKNLWLPLGMTHSYFGATPYLLAADRSNRFQVEADSVGGERVVAMGRDFDPGITIPNGGWNAPLTDLARWVAFLTGATGGDRETARRFDGILGRGSLEEMWRPVVTTGGPMDEAMGLSFFLRRLRGASVVGHTGTQGGFRSFLWINRATGDAVIAVVNTSNDADEVASAEGLRAVMDAALDVIVP